MSTFNPDLSQVGDGNLNEPLYVGRIGQPVVLNGQPTVILSTISELSTANSTYTTAVVKDALRGGTFNWSATGTVDNGITFAASNGYWVRQFTGAIHPEWFGAATGGITDCALAINAADTAATLLGSYVEFKGLEYLVNSELIISAPWVGIPNKTRITFGVNYAHTTTYLTHIATAYMWNKNTNVSTYNDATADKVNISGIEFLRKKNDTYVTTLTLANVNGGTIKNCKFFGSTSVTTYMDLLNLHASVKNMTIEDNEFRNETTWTAGGCIWVRNLTFGTTDVEGNATENIVIRHNKFVKNNGDEIIAVTGVYGLTKNIRIENNNLYASTTTQGTLITVGVDANASYTTYAEVRDVQVVGNYIRSDSCTLNDIIRAGVAGDAIAKLNDIIIERNEIMYDAPSSGSRRGISQIAGANVKALANTVINIGTTYAVQEAISGVGFVQSNTILDKSGAAAPTAYGIVSATWALNNTINTTGIGLRNCGYSEANQVTALIPFSAASNGKFDAVGNHFTLTASAANTQAIYFNNLGGAVNPSGWLRENYITMSDGAHHRCLLKQGTGLLKFTNNYITGAGSLFTGAIDSAGGNYISGSYYDDYFTSSAVSADILASYPLGHIIRNSAPSIDVNNNILSGWMIIDNAGRAWQALYTKHVSP